MKLRSLALISLISALSITTACGNSNSNTGSVNSGTSNTTTSSSSNSSQSTASSNESTGLTGEFEIQYFVGGYGDGWWLEVLDGFQKANPDLEIIHSAGPKINEQMQPRWIQNDPPDVVYIDGAGSNERQMVLDDQLMDITEYLQTATNVDGELIKDILIAQPSDYDGKNYNLPLVFGSWGLFYDKALFSQNSWEVPSNWDEFIAVSEKIKAAGTSPLIHTGMYPYYVNGGLIDSAMVSANGGDTSILLDQVELKEGAFSSDAVKTALYQFKELVDKGFIDAASVSLNHTDSQSQWLQHKAGFIPNGLWLENEMKADVPAGFDFGFIPSVAQKAGESNIVIPYTSTIAIAKNAKNPEAAKAFVEFAFTKQNALRWAEITGAIMNVKADLTNSSASGVVKDAMNFFNDDNTIVAPVAVLNADVEKVKQDSTLALSMGKITPEDWMQRLEDAAAKAR